MKELLIEALKSPFVSGLLLGLVAAGFLWKAGFSRNRALSREIKRLEGELKDLGKHLNTQLKINASGNESQQAELEALREQNENLRVHVATLQQKPGRAELRQFHIQEAAIRQMREQAPGFAPAWEKTLRQAEAEAETADTGLRKLVRRVIPGIASSAPAAETSSPTADAGDR